jgi:NAD(P)-dependent dehydrogenase (short-subunit alcohol dehydrogenase family)|tara:strand:- start:12250 stop:12987 length:738 start_codon:yes stop_codon:yes gene_type:complete
MNYKINNILVTGAGKGIGQATTNLLISKGKYVYALIKDKNDNKKFKGYNNLKIINGDVNNLNLIKKIFKDANKNKKIITGLVNNAGIRQRKDFLKINKIDLKNIFDTNFFSVFYLMQIFTKNLIEKKVSGAIVNISSIVGQTGFSELSSYASTKGALISLTKCFATEMAKYKIRANSISPGFTETSYFKNFKKKQKLYNWTLSRIPLKRWGRSDEISNLIFFLLSKDASYINGENINIDGGWLSS